MIILLIFVSVFVVFFIGLYFVERNDPVIKSMNSVIDLMKKEQDKMLNYIAEDEIERRNGGCQHEYLPDRKDDKYTIYKCKHCGKEREILNIFVDNNEQSTKTAH